MSRDTMNTIIPFLDLSVADREERAAILAAVGRVLDHGRIILGPEVEQLEAELARHAGRVHGIGVGCGTDALYLAFRALGLGPGDEVITPALVWLATANAIASVGARPVFADIGADFNLDPDSVEACISPRTRAILAVHASGRMCDMARLEAIAARHGIPLVEDASQAFGAQRDGRRAGGCGAITAMSLNPMKLLAACGEAGMVLTDDPVLAQSVARLRHHGMVDKEVCGEVGLNMRLDTMQAAILLARLPGIEARIARRRQIAARYSAQLADLVAVPADPAQERHVFFVYTVLTERRDDLAAHLAGRGIEARVRDRILVPCQPAHGAAPPANWPMAEHLAGRMLSLPMQERMPDEDVDTVASAVRAFFHG